VVVNASYNDNYRHRCGTTVAAAAAMATLAVAIYAVVAAAAADSTAAAVVMMAVAMVTVGVIVVAAAASAEDTYPEEALNETSLDAGAATESDGVPTLDSDLAEFWRQCSTRIGGGAQLGRSGCDRLGFGGVDRSRA
jgi:hypothetical protein